MLTQITFRSFPRSEALSDRIQERAEELDEVYERLVSCRVMIEAPHRHHRKGRIYHVRIGLGVPGQKLVISSDPTQAHAHEDPYVAVRDAFDAARRRLEGFAKRTRARKRRAH